MFTLTRKELIDRNFLCGVPFFDSVAPSGTLVLDEWTAMHSAMLASIDFGGPLQNGFRWLLELEASSLVPVHNITIPDGHENSITQMIRKGLLLKRT